MTHGMAWRVQRLELDRLAHFDDIARAQASGHVVDLVLGILVRQNSRSGFSDHSLVAARMVAMFVRVQDLGDIPSFFLGGPQTLFMIQGIDGQGLAGFATGDEVVEIAVGVGGPDLFDYHGIIPSQWRPTMVARNKSHYGKHQHDAILVTLMSTNPLVAAAEDCCDLG